MLDMAPQTDTAAATNANIENDASVSPERPRSTFAYGLAIALGIPFGWLAGMIVALFAGFIELMLC